MVRKSTITIKRNIFFCLSVCYCMVYASVWEDNPRALASDEGSPIRYNSKFPAQSPPVSIYSYEVLCSVESDLDVNLLQSRKG